MTEKTIADQVAEMSRAMAQEPANPAMSTCVMRNRSQGRTIGHGSGMKEF
ncbi:hypothetical protein [Nocardioides sp.]|jgi:hypothetical protein|nr:hypothetical protein [Nocardioides sp.]HVX53202.1 hypothetical protein [Nocardioides sp.]